MIYVLRSKSECCRIHTSPELLRLPLFRVRVLVFVCAVLENAQGSLVAEYHHASE